MNRKIYYTRLGLFVLIGTFLVSATVIYVGSVRLFAREMVLLMYFGESVNGLSVGSPVKFKGVTIGSVSEIQVAYDLNQDIEQSFVPVFAKINLDRTHRDFGRGGSAAVPVESNLPALIENGLRARLEMQSFITGQLYVEFDYFAPPGAEYRLLQHGSSFQELPTVPSTLAELGASASSIMASVASIDIKGTNDGAKRLINTLEEKLAVMETAKWNTAILDLTASMQTRADELEIRPLIEEMRATNMGLQALVAKVDEAVDPALQEYQETLVDARNTLSTIDRTFARIDQTVAHNAGLGMEMESSLIELREAARAMREFLEFLERNPRALLTGREQP